LELSNLHRQVRPNDICLTVGCGSQPALSKFYTFSTPVLNSFLEQAVQNQPRLIKTTYIPILPVDLMLQDILGRKRILLLSIDVEGLDLEVLRGATKTLENTIWVCIETGINTSEITDLLCESGFLEHAKIGCNVFFKNVN
jgi:FkbM family methyltransferase